MSDLTVGRLVAFLEVEDKAWDPPLNKAERDLRDAERSTTTSLDHIARAFGETGKAGAKTGDTVGAAMKSMTDRVEAAEARMARAQDRQAAAWERVAKAQAAVDKQAAAATPNAERLAAAQGRLDAALQRLSATQDQVIQSSNVLARAQLGLRDAGEQAGEALTEGVEAGVKKGAGTLSRTWQVLGAAQVLIPLMSYTGELAGGAIVAGFGAGIIGLGIKAASEADKVQNAFGALVDYVTKRAQHIAKPFEAELVRISGQARLTWDGMEKGLEAAMARLAPATSRFTGKVAAAIRSSEPVLEPMGRAAEKMLDALGDRMPSIIGDLSAQFADLAHAIEKNPEALADFVGLIANAVEFVVLLAEGFTIVNSKIASAARALDPFHVVFDEISETAPGIDGVSSALDGAAASTAKLKDEQKDAAKAAKDHADRLDDLVQAAGDMIGSNLDLRQAVRNARDDMADYTEAVKKHGVASDEAAEAQLRAEESNWRLAQAVSDAALAEQDATGKVRDLAAATTAARDRLLAQAEAASGPLKKALLDQAAALDVVLSKLKAMDRTFTSNVDIHVSTTGAAARGLNLPFNRQFARGGSIQAGEIGEVAEHGKPEMLTAAGKHYLLMGNQGGHITPSDQLAAMAGGAGGGGGTARIELLVRPAPGMSADLGSAVVRSLAYEVRAQYGGDITLVTR